MYARICAICFVCVLFVSACDMAYSCFGLLFAVALFSLYACVYACIVLFEHGYCVCLYVCIHVHTYLRERSRTHAHQHRYTDTDTNIRTHQRTHAHKHTHSLSLSLSLSRTHAMCDSAVGVQLQAGCKWHQRCFAPMHFSPTHRQRDTNTHTHIYTSNTHS